MNNRGISDVVSTVLIIMIVVVSISIVGVIIMRSVNNLSENIETGSTPITLSIPGQTVYVTDSNDYVYLNVQRKPGDGEMTGMNVVFYDASGQTHSETIDGSVNVFESKSMIVALPVGFGELKKIEAYPIAKTTKGKVFIGRAGAIYEKNYDNIVSGSVGVPGGGAIKNIGGVNVYVNCDVGPDIPSGLSAADGAPALNQVTLSWSASSCTITGYRLYRSNSPTGTYNLLTSVGPTVLSHIDTTAGPNTWYYKVSSINGAVESAQSAYVTGTGCTSAPSAPAAPTAPLLTITQKSAVLNWIAVSCASSYDLYRDGASIATGLTTATYTDNSLSPEKTYSYYVRAVNSIGFAQSVALPVTTLNREGGVGAPTGLLAYYKFDETAWIGSNNEVIDSSPSSFHATAKYYSLVGTPGLPTVVSDTIMGKTTNVGNFDGVNDYVIVGNPTSRLDFGANQDFSIAFWIKAAAVSNMKPISKGNVDSSTKHYGFWTAGSSVILKFADGTTAYPTGIVATTSLDNTWHHVVYTMDRDGLCRAFRDGVSGASVTCGGAGADLSNGAAFTMGANGGGTGSFFAGRMDEVRVYNRVLTSTEISNLKNSYS